MDAAAIQMQVRATLVLVLLAPEIKVAIRDYLSLQTPLSMPRPI